MKKILAVIMVVAMMAALSTSLFAVEKLEKADTITGDLTVTGFFNESTKAIEFKSGDSYTFKFNNKSNDPTKNYTNFVLAICGALSEKYGGSDEEILIMRADNWAWGGKMSDIEEPGKETNPVKVESNITDWDAFKAAMGAGLNVEITLTRDGNTITYDAKMGDFTTKMTATSGKDLPETAYVFFTGEQVTLTGITTTKNAPAQGGDKTDETTAAGGQGGAASGNGGDKAPQTGVATVALAIAAISSGAYVVTKKRH